MSKTTKIIAVSIKGETEKAIMINNEWLPKNEITINGDIVEVPLWLRKKLNNQYLEIFPLAKETGFDSEAQAWDDEITDNYEDDWAWAIANRESFDKMVEVVREKYNEVDGNLQKLVGKKFSLGLTQIAKKF